MIDVILVILLVCALISAIGFNQGVPSIPEWNPFEIFFQGYLGWDIFKTTVVCVGGWLILFAIVFVIGRVTGWSKGLWFHPDKDMTSSEKVKGKMLMPAIALMIIMFLIALYKMGV